MPALNESIRGFLDAPLFSDLLRSQFKGLPAAKLLNQVSRRIIGSQLRFAVSHKNREQKFREVVFLSPKFSKRFNQSLIRAVRPRGVLIFDSYFCKPLKSQIRRAVLVSQGDLEAPLDQLRGARLVFGRDVAASYP